MRVRTRSINEANCPPRFDLNLNAYRNVTIGREYEVHCLVVLDGHSFVLLVDDRSMPHVFPMWFFDLVDGSIPEDWITTHLHDPPFLAVGPEFIVKDAEAYNAMVESDPDPLHLFWQRDLSMKVAAVARELQSGMAGEVAAVLAETRRYDPKAALEKLCELVFEHDLQLSASVFETIARLAKRAELSEDDWQYLPHD